MPPINRLTQSNGRTQATEQQRFAADRPVTQSAASVELKRVLRKYPGTVLILGFVAGGIIGWLTSKRSR